MSPYPWVIRTPREQRLDVPASDVELREHLQDDVVLAQLAAPVE
ncbi:hypothetical protein [Actinoallomurus sp. NPDC050550]